jgi:hypothetical protein
LVIASEIPEQPVESQAYPLAFSLMAFYIFTAGILLSTATHI